MRISFNSFPTRIAEFLLLLTMATPTQAADFSDRGVYLGVSGIYTSSLFQEEVLSYGGLPASVAKVSDSAGVSARLGYRAMSWIALEIQYEWLDTVNFSNAVQGKFAEYNPQTVTANVKLFLPSGALQPYLLAGAGIVFWQLDTLALGSGAVPASHSSGNGFTGRAGLGLNFHLSDHLALNAEAVAVLNTTTLDPTETQLDQTLGNLYYFSFGAGLSYRF
jgi:outer membrane protein W